MASPFRESRMTSEIAMYTYALYTSNVHVLMRDEKDVYINKKAKQHNTPKAVTFSRKARCLGWDSNPQLHTLHRTRTLYYVHCMSSVCPLLPATERVKSQNWPTCWTRRHTSRSSTGNWSQSVHHNMS